MIKVKLVFNEEMGIFIALAQNDSKILCRKFIYTAQNLFDYFIVEYSTDLLYYKNIVVKQSMAENYVILKCIYNRKSGRGLAFKTNFFEFFEFRTFR